MIAQVLRTVPSNYTRPLPVPSVEKSLRGTIYDPWVRQIMWEGVMNKWQNETAAWLACPDSTTSPRRSDQVVLTNLLEGTSMDDSVICPYDWAKPIHLLNCRLVWPAALDEVNSTPRKSYVELDTPEVRLFLLVLATRLHLPTSTMEESKMIGSWNSCWLWQALEWREY